MFFIGVKYILAGYAEANSDDEEVFLEISKNFEKKLKN